MANPVTYNSGSAIAGSLNSGSMSMSVGTSLDITGYNWRNGFENNNIWVIYSDTFSMGLSTQGNAVPTIWASPVYTESGLITLINSLSARAGQTPFTNITDAVNWLYGQGKYFLSNQNYPLITTQNLIAFWDAGLAASYPRIGTTFYNLGTTVNATLTNGPTWNNNNTKSYFDLDGSDDYIAAASMNLQQDFSIECVVKMDVVSGFCFFGQGITSPNSGLHIWIPTGLSNTLRYGMYSNDSDWVYGSGGLSANLWYHFVFTYSNSAPNYVKEIYFNGIKTNASNVSGPAAYIGSGQFNIGAVYSDASVVGNGKFAYVRIYNKVLNSDEILQNFYKGPIVTSNLTHLWDASNLVSYQDSSSTTAYDLKGTNNGTLQNGVSYVNSYGGYWEFDGSDDRITTSTVTPGNGNWTLNIWARGTGGLVGNTSGGPVASSFGIVSGYVVYYNYDGQWRTNLGNTLLDPDEWYMISFVNYQGNSPQDGTMKIYVNGVADSSVFNSYTTNGGPVDSIGYSIFSLGYFNGSIGSVQWNGGTAFNDSQILQQYNATKYRFDSYEALISGGTETTLTQNGVTYRVHTFTTSGSLSVKKGGDVEVLMVAGGGGGGSGANSFWEAGGGGGAGGLIHSTGFRVEDNTNYTITIGAGGVGGLNQTNTTPSNRSGNGSNTTFSTLTAIGGGGGGGAYYGPDNGGSGGGAEGRNLYPNGSGTQFQGYNGGVGNGISSTAGAGGGGGGAGGVGQNGQTPYPHKGGDGGIGRPFTFSGNTEVYYAGGGGGKTAVDGAGIGGVGGLGGGGNGGFAGGEALGSSGGTNTGGGGGGGLSTSTPTGSGGSGLVMIRYIIN
jgi:hypothetical protein